MANALLTREELVELLLEDYMDGVAAGTFLVEDLLVKGFKGFDHMTYDELYNDAKCNNLLPPDEDD